VQTADAATVAAGAAQYGIFCGRCHGGGANYFGILPDLRYSAAISDPALFAGVVHEGLLAANGMANFSEALDETQVEAIRAFLVDRANALAAQPPAQ
jgi:alcohol dehydrogenase (cytochrome c)/quinohemoprotein ethanol dehydrogenase